MLVIEYLYTLEFIHIVCLLTSSFLWLYAPSLIKKRYLKRNELLSDEILKGEFPYMFFPKYNMFEKVMFVAIFLFSFFFIFLMIIL